MNQKQFSEFYRKIEVCEFGKSGYIYYYATNISLCANRLRSFSGEDIEGIVSYCMPHGIEATVVLTKLRFWKMKQNEINKKLIAGGCHMKRETIAMLYDCNEYVLSRSLSWQKNWSDQPVFKAAKEAKSRGIGFMELIKNLLE